MPLLSRRFIVLECSVIKLSLISYHFLCAVDYSLISLTKTQRDLHERKKIVSRVDEAKVEKLLSEHN